jgi:hypothetical protein
MFRNYLFVSLVLIAGSLRAQSTCTPGSNASNFDGTPIHPGTSIWFNANFSARGIPSTGATISFTNSTISLTADQPYTINVPNAQITFDPHAVCSSTTFNSGTNTWMTTVPLAGSDEIFLSGVSFPVPAGFDAVGGHVPGAVTWQGTFKSETAGLSVSWKWGAAVYSSFTTDYNSLGVKPTHSQTCLYQNGDHAGTPEGTDPSSGRLYKSFVVGGARGGGGSNWTGSWSGTQGVSVCVATVSPTFCLTMQKQFFDPGANTTSPDPLGWGMSLTNPSGAVTQFTTDGSGQVTACQLPVGTYTVTEARSGPVPTATGCTADSTIAIPYQIFLNGASQPLGSVTFTGNSAQPMTVLFVNELVCEG